MDGAVNEDAGGVAGVIIARPKGDDHFELYRGPEA